MFPSTAKVAIATLPVTDRESGPPAAVMAKLFEFQVPLAPVSPVPVFTATVVTLVWTVAGAEPAARS